MKNIGLTFLMLLGCQLSYGQDDLNMGTKKIIFTDGDVGGLNLITSSKASTYQGEWLFNTDYSYIKFNAGKNPANAQYISFNIGGVNKLSLNSGALEFGLTPIRFSDGGVGGSNMIKSSKVSTYQGEWLFNTDYSYITFNAGINPENAQFISFKIGGETQAIIRKSLFSVCGTLRANEVKVDLTGCDFVFEKDYKLMPLNELEKFVKEQKHLPEIAPAKEMENNGTDLGVLTSKLLQKIEELTLYTIEQNKKFEEQNQELKILKAKIKKLESNKR